MFDWLKPLIDIFAGAAPAVGEGTQALGAGAEAAGSGGFNIMPFLGDLWGTASNFAGSDIGKGVLGAGAMLGAGALANGPEAPSFPSPISFGPMPGAGAQSAGAAASPPPPGTNVSPLLQEGKPPMIRNSQGLDLEEKLRKGPMGGMGVAV